MSDIDSILDKTDTGGITYWDESQEKPNVAMPEGEYPANIVKVDTTTRKIKGMYKALIYNLTYKLSDVETTEYEAVDYDGNDVKVKNSQFAGREIKGMGIFKFLQPNGHDDFEANPGGNKAYANFCQVLGSDPKITEIEVEGKTVKVRELPDISENDVLGMPVKAVIRKGKPWTSNRDGVTRTPLEVKWLRHWDGPKMSASDLMSADEDLPF